MKENKIVVLSDVEHALKRAPMYIGSTHLETIDRPIIEDGKIVFQQIKYVPALFKLMHELLDNAIDEYVRTGGKYANKIDIKIDNKSFIVRDNGRGIPIQPAYDSQGNEIPDSWAPLNAWTNLKAGSNFGDEADNTTLGSNGVGASLATIFSKQFIGETDDGKKHFKVIAKNNMSEIKYNITKPKRQGTIVYFEPDFERFEENEIRDIYIKLLEFDLNFIAITYPGIEFTLNGKKIKFKSIRTLNNELFDGKLEIEERDDIIVAIMSSADWNGGYRIIQFINGLNAYRGGKTLDYLEKRILEPLRDKLAARNKGITLADIKNNILFLSVWRNMPNPRFDTQMKEYCINTPSQFPEIAKQILDIGNSRFIDRVYKNKEIVQPIIDLHKAKQLVAEKKDLKKAIKNNKISSKYWPATGEKKYLVISEGDSAVGSILDGLGRSVYGFFPIKGKVSNVIKDPKALQKDKELLEIIKIMGFLEEIEKYNYENLVFATDADADGSHIASLLAAFIYKVAPEMLKNGKVFRFQTPVIVAYKNDKIDKFFFTFDEYKDYVKKASKGVKYEYKKGLGSLEESEWEYLFKNYTFEDLLVPLVIKDDEDEKVLDAWMNEDRDYRKKAIKEGLPGFSLDVV